MKKERYDLTNPQKSIWYTEQFYQGSCVNNLCGTVLMNQVVDFDKLKESIYQFVKDNDSFRLQLQEDETGEVKQSFADFSPFPIEMLSLHNEEELDALENGMVDIPFPLFHSNLHHFTMFRLPNGTGGFVLVAHHLICDACTAGLLASKVMNIYASLLKKEEPTETPTSYVNYMVSEQDYLASNKFEKDKLYWNTLLETIPEIGRIPSMKQNKTNSYKATRKTFLLEKEKVEKINCFCSEHKLSSFNFFMALYAIYIGRVANLDDFVVGTPILNRSTFIEKNTPGMFISTVPFRFVLKEEDSFLDFAKRIAFDSLGMFRHQKYPYQNILEDIRKKNPSQPNLYDILISYQNTRTNRNYADIPYSVKWTFNHNVADSMQIHLFDMNDEGFLNISYDYRLDQYEEEDICALHERICFMIEQILTSPTLFLKDMEIVTPKEKDMLLHDFNHTVLAYDKTKNVVTLIEEQVAKTPNSIALVCDNITLTYQELNQKANQLAHYLIEHQVKPKDMVGIMLHRSPEMIIGLLAILKVGATYLPIDPEYPIDRISYMLEDSNCQTILMDASTISFIEGNYTKFNISLSSSIYHSNKIEKPAITICPDDLIYMIYTSGSTGNPKGVMLTHQNIYNFIKAEKEVIDFSQNKVMVSVTTICFDIFALEIWCTLTSGMKVVLATDTEQMSPILLRKLCQKHKVNMIQTTPSRFSTLLANSNDLDFLHDFTDIMVGGEPFPKQLLEKFHKYTKANIFNMYGPTETTVWSTIKDLTHTSTITIGKPIANTTCYILDKHKKLLPPYVPGELYIGGDGVSKGYWKREDLTHEKFITSPFQDNEIIYNTNDLAYFTKNGEIVHLGRTDFQVKIRGYRIELEEIENKVLQFPSISHCVVNPVDNATKLCAYYISDQEINVSDLRNYLSQELPNYMVPNYFVRMERFFYTPNGKINKKALPLPTLTTYKEIIAARNEIDTFLITELQTSLGIQQISISDSFFEIGGDSLTAIHLSTKLANRYSIDFMVRDIFEHPVLQEMSDFISSRIKENSMVPVAEDNLLSAVSAQGNFAISIEKVEEKPYYEVSSAQRRVYYASKMAGEHSILYNMPGVITFHQMPDIPKLKQCLQKLVARHPSLRTSFEIIEGNLYQKVATAIDFKLEEKTENEKSVEEITKDFVKPFSLENAPLFRACLVTTKQGVLLLLDMHHMISDGLSISILADELCKLYNGHELTKLSFTYIDYTYYMNRLLAHDCFAPSIAYWNSIFPTSIPTLTLPYDRERPPLKSTSGAKIHCAITKELSFKINMLSKELNISNFMILLASYYILLYKYSGNHDIVIGTPVVGRNKEEFSHVIGMFVNTLAIRNSIQDTMSFMQFLDCVKESCIGAFEHQLYPFDEMIQKVNKNRDVSRNPFFDVMFSYQNRGIASIDFDQLETTFTTLDTAISKFDLTLEVIPNEDTFTLNFEYCTDLFDATTIERFAKQYLNILNIVLDNISIPIQNIDILSSEEKQKLKLMDKNSTIKEWILQFPNVKDVFVKEMQDNQNRTITIAYLAVSDRVPITNLRAFLHKNLPKHMVPTHFMNIEKVPYLENGMVEETLLPLPTCVSSHNTVTYYPPRTTLELKITNMFQKILGICPISIKDSFFDLGGDSLMAMSLQIELMKITKNITYSDIFIYTTVEELAKQIEQYIAASSSHFLSDDFSSLESVLQKNLVVVPNIEKQEIGNILITGVTGFLGAHILEEYLQQYPNGTIYCLIRPEVGLTLEKKLLNKLHFYFGNQYDSLLGKQILIVKGDITKENFGLSQEELTQLSTNVDCVINSAAKVAHYGDYSIFKNINVIGTQNVVQFCKTFQKRLYHISTLSVSGNAFMSQSYVENKIEGEVRFDESCFYIHQSLENVYVRSKFEAEKYVLEEMKNGLNAYLLRIGNLMPRILDGKFQTNRTENAYANRLLSFAKLGKIPDYLLEDYAEFTPVDSCAQAIVKLMQYPSNTNRVFHLFNPNHVTVNELLTIFRHFLTIEVVPDKEFLAYIDAILNRDHSDELLAGILGDFNKDRKLVYNSNIKLNCDFTVQYLQRIGFIWPTIPEDYLTNFFKLLYKEEN